MNQYTEALTVRLTIGYEEVGRNEKDHWCRFFELCQEYAEIARERAEEAEGVRSEGEVAEEAQMMRLENWK